MPRRPRPQSRKPPTHDQQRSANNVVAPKPKPVSRPTARREAEESTSEEEEEFEEGASGSGSASAEEEYEDELDADTDAPRIAQWEDDEELDAAEQSDSDAEDAEDSVRPADLTRLQRDLSSLPLGTLRKAQQALTQTRHSDEEGSSDEREESDDESAPEEEASRPDATGSRERREIARRPNKHAPMEMTSKRPVPRKKANIEESKPVPRDPRFLHTSGTFDPTHFRSQYGFLSEMHQTELSTLRENLKRARKLLITSPRDLRQEREAEVQRLERAVKRAESTVNKDKKDKIEESALKKVRHEEKEKRKSGKGAWYMKEADKKELFTRAKFEALAEAGGRGAVRKAIEKKQKKVDQKEKKKRPFVPGEGRGPNGKRLNGGGSQSQGGRPPKRLRTS